MVESYCDNEDQVEEQLSLDQDQQVLDVQYQEKKVIDLQKVEQDSSNVNLMDQDDVMQQHYHVVMDQMANESLKVALVHQQVRVMVMDERVDYYDSLIMDHDVEMVVVDQMDEVLVVLYPKKMIISKKKMKNRRLFLFSNIQINFDLLV
jgi:hypothetical protein